MAEATQANEERARAIHERAEAAQAMIKLDEARLLLNKLLGPQGPLSMAERHKFLSGNGGGNVASGNTSIDNTINDRDAFDTYGITQGQVARADTSSREALGQQRSDPQQHGAKRANDDDEFWYDGGA